MNTAATDAANFLNTLKRWATDQRKDAAERSRAARIAANPEAVGYAAGRFEVADDLLRMLRQAPRPRTIEERNKLAFDNLDAALKALRRFGLALLLVVLVVGCAATPPPDPLVTAITSAMRAGTPVSAPAGGAAVPWSTAPEADEAPAPAAPLPTVWAYTAHRMVSNTCPTFGPLAATMMGRWVFTNQWIGWQKIALVDGPRVVKDRYVTRTARGRVDANCSLLTTVVMDPSHAAGQVTTVTCGDGRCEWQTDGVWEPVR